MTASVSLFICRLTCFIYSFISKWWKLWFEFCSELVTSVLPSWDHQDYQDHTRIFVLWNHQMCICKSRNEDIILNLVKCVRFTALAVISDLPWNVLVLLWGKADLLFIVKTMSKFAKWCRETDSNSFEAFVCSNSNNIGLNLLYYFKLLIVDTYFIRYNVLIWLEVWCQELKSTLIFINLNFSIIFVKTVIIFWKPANYIYLILWNVLQFLFCQVN